MVVLTVLLGGKVPGQSSALGAHIHTSTNRNKTANVDRIKHKFIVLVFQQNQCLNIEKHAVHNIHRFAWGPYFRGALGQSMLYTTYIDSHGAPIFVDPSDNYPACPRH